MLSALQRYMLLVDSNELAAADVVQDIAGSI
jgi:hypothetical protein